MNEKLVTVQFCPSGNVQQRSKKWLVARGFTRQLNEIASGKKLDAVIVSDALEIE